MFRLFDIHLFLNLNLYLFMRLCERMTHACGCPQRAKEGVRSSGDEVTSGCESLDTGAGNLLRACGRAASALNLWAISQPHDSVPSYTLNFDCFITTEFWMFSVTAVCHVSVSTCLFIRFILKQLRASSFFLSFSFFWKLYLVTLGSVKPEMQSQTLFTF